ncbi:DUF4292 domain-containing protein [Raineya orbicola]|jgi:hypothetical protein|uniref:DUF4292 domain-containing protein n=1 Tax=Raineya orbicola TaxID=2016530 RepID=A0A2N3IBY8_9BACT|nr:DUF4292 domain-containing protein [Raineya orbicola]PKQ67826.1 hypothetical protein Rain11_1916 [Raineya orbicola]
MSNSIVSKPTSTLFFIPFGGLHGKKVILLFAFAFALLFLGSSCRKKRIQPIKDNTQIIQNPLPAGQDVQESKENFFSLSQKPALLNFKYLSSNSKIDFTDGTNEEKFKTTMRIRKDSVIWLSLQANVGVEGMRILIDKDSIRFLNYQAKTYQSYSFGQLSEQYGISLNYALCQAILIGEMPIKEFDEKKVLKDTAHYIIRQRMNFLQIDNYLRLQDSQMEKLWVSDMERGSQLQIIYSNFQPLAEGLFPDKNQITLNYRNAQGTFQLKLDIDHKKTKISDTPLDFPFSVPKKYGRL